MGEGDGQASTSSEGPQAGPGRRGRGLQDTGTEAVLQARALIDAEKYLWL